MTARLKRAAEALGAKCRALSELFSGPLAASFTSVPREDELELAQLYAEYYIADKHPLLAAFSTFSVQREPSGDSVLQFRCNLPLRSLLSFGACLELGGGELTRFGQLQPAVRNQIEAMIHGAEQDIAEAIDGRAEPVEEDH